MKSLLYNPSILRLCARDEMLETSHGVKVSTNQVACLVETWGLHFNKSFKFVREELEDLLINALTKCCCNADKFDCAKASISTWVKVVVAHTFYDVCRKHTEEKVALDDVLFYVANLSDSSYTLEHNARYAWVEAEIKKLSPEKQRVMKMYLDEKSVSEIAKEEGCTPTKISVMVHRTTEKFRQELERQRALDSDLAQAA